jgi:hypothetical protein
MTQEKHEILSFNGRIEIDSAASLIQSAQYPLTEDLHAALVKTLDVECGQLDQSVRNQEFARVLASESTEELARNRVAEARKEVAEAEQAAKTHGARGSWVKVAIWTLCGTACFAAEFVLTWTALCFVLNVERFSVLGVLLGLAPPSGLAVLEVVLARLFEEPWQRMRAATASPRGLLVRITMGILLVVLAAGNGLTILHLAKAREEAGKATRALADTHDNTPAQIDQEAIDRAVLSVSLLVTIDGALFLLLSLAEGARLRSRIRIDREVRRSRNEFLRLEGELAGAQSATGSARESWKTVDEKARLCAERYRTHCLYRMNEKTAAFQLNRPIEELIDRSLRLRVMA